MNHLDTLMLATPNFRSTAAVHSPSPRSDINGILARQKARVHEPRDIVRLEDHREEGGCYLWSRKSLDGLRNEVVRKYEEVGGHKRNGLILVSSMSGLVILASLRLREEVEDKKESI